MLGLQLVAVWEGLGGVAFFGGGLSLWVDFEVSKAQAVLLALLSHDCCLKMRSQLLLQRHACLPDPLLPAAMVIDPTFWNHNPQINTPLYKLPWHHVLSQKLTSNQL